ncbi:MAG: EamA family transporter [Acidobacteriota bacterium]
MSVLRGRTLAMYVALCAVWGSTWLAIKIGLRDLPPLWFAGIRMAVACLLLTPFAFRGSAAPLSGKQKRWVAWAGLLQIGIAYACVFQAEEWIASGLAALLFATFPIFVGLFAHFMLPDERLRPRAILAALLGVAGVAVIEGPEAWTALQGTTGTLVAGGVLMLISAVAAAYSNVAFKKHLGGVAPVLTTWGQTLAGSVFLLLLAAAFERGAVLRWTASSVSALLYLAIAGTALPFAGLFWLLRRVPVAVIGTIPIVDTVIAIVLGSLVLGETFSPRVLAGGGFILAGVLLAASPAPQGPPDRKKKETAAIK